MPYVSGHLLSHWGKIARAEEFTKAANGLLAASTYEDRLHHLRIFSRRAFPIDPEPLLDWVTSGDEKIAFAASSVVGLIRHPAMRDIAFELVEERTPGRKDAIAMLDQNWQSGDLEVALAWFENETEDTLRHWMGIDLRQMLEHHPQPGDERKILYSRYENGPCSFCRESIVRRLIELECLTDQMRTECAYDASYHVRDLVTTKSPSVVEQ
jgi:hypothetical protein